MNPYAPLFSNPVDLAVAWIFTGSWTVAGAFLLRPCFMSLQNRGERFCATAAVALLGLSALIAFVFVVGLVSLVWLKLTSAFWFIWELFYLMSVVCVFRTLPILVVALVGWAALGRWRSHFSVRSLRICATAVLGVALDILLYFAIEINVA